MNTSQSPFKALSQQLYIQLAVCALTTALMSALWHQDILLTGLLLATFIGANLLWKRDPNDYIIYVCAFILAPMIDIFNIAAGVWSYGTEPLFLQIPLWLPFGYGIGILGLYKSGRTVAEMVEAW